MCRYGGENGTTIVSEECGRAFKPSECGARERKDAVALSLKCSRMENRSAASVVFHIESFRDGFCASEVDSTYSPVRITKGGGRMAAMLLRHCYHQYPQCGYRQRTASGTKPN